MTTTALAAEAARLALVGAAAYPDPDDAEQSPLETAAEYVARLVFAGALAEEATA